MGTRGSRKRLLFTTKKAAEKHLSETVVKVDRGEYLEIKKLPTFAQAAELCFDGKTDRRPSCVADIRTVSTCTFFPRSALSGSTRSASPLSKSCATVCASRTTRRAPQHDHPHRRRSLSLRHPPRRSHNQSRRSNRARLHGRPRIAWRRRRGQHRRHCQPGLHPVAGRNRHHARRHDARPLSPFCSRRQLSQARARANYSRCACPTLKCRTAQPTSTSAAPYRERGVKGEDIRPRYYPPKTKAAVRRIQITRDLDPDPESMEAPVSAVADELVFPTADLQAYTQGCKCPAQGQYALPASHLRFGAYHGRCACTEVQTLHGHASPAITLRIYSHWFKAQDSGAVDRLNALILKSGKSGHKMDTKLRNSVLPSEKSA